MVINSRAGRMLRPRPLLPVTVAELVRRERRSRLDTESIRRDQLVALNQALRTAADAPFWAERLGGVRLLEDLADIRRLPTTDKQTLRAVPEQARLTAEPPDGSRTLETSGTTGEPFRVLYSPGGAWWQGVLRLWVHYHWGLRPWHRRASVSLFTDPDRRRRGVLSVVKSARHVTLPSSDDVSNLANRLAESRATYVGGYPHLLIEVGDELDGRYRPRALATHGETLSHESRAALRTHFGVDPFDQYGTAECGFVAWQCTARDLYHVNHDAVHVEILDDTGELTAPDEPGELVLTELWNPLMPFVRYRMGDSSAWASRPCVCGSTLPALTHIHGRTYGWVLDAEGNRVAPQRLWMGVVGGLETFYVIRRYQVRQRRDRRLEIDIVPGQGFGPEHRTEIAAAYRRLLGDVPIEIRMVDRLATSPEEKFEVITSEAEFDD